MRDVILVQDAGLSVRTTNALAGAGYYSMNDVVQASHYELRLIPEFGRKSISEVERWAADRGLVAGEERVRLKRTLKELEARREIIERDIASICARLAT